MGMNIQNCLIGIGNELRKDDAIGVVLLRMLCESDLNELFDFYEAGNDLFSLWPWVRSYQSVFMIDALPPDRQPGKMQIMNGFDNITSKKVAYSLHDLDVCQQLHYIFNQGYRGNVYLIGIEASDIGLGIGLSPDIQHILPELFKNIHCWLRGFLSKKISCGDFRSRVKF